MNTRRKQKSATQKWQDDNKERWNDYRNKWLKTCRSCDKPINGNEVICAECQPKIVYTKLPPGKAKGHAYLNRWSIARKANESSITSIPEEK